MRNSKRLVLVGWILALSASCATVTPVADVRIPEPAMPACLLELPAREGEMVGILRIAPGYEAVAVQAFNRGDAGQTIVMVITCLEQTMAGYREALAIIRAANH